MSSFNEIPSYVTSTTPASLANSSLYGGRGPPQNESNQETTEDFTTFYDLFNFLKASLMVM